MKSSKSTRRRRIASLALAVAAVGLGLAASSAPSLPSGSGDTHESSYSLRKSGRTWAAPVLHHVVKTVR
jgi:hypothetical protein